MRTQNKKSKSCKMSPKMTGILNVGQADLHLAPGEDYVREVIHKQLEKDKNKQIELENQLKEFPASSQCDSINIDGEFNLSKLLKRGPQDMNLNTEFNKTQFDFNNQTGNFTPLANIYKNGKTLDKGKLSKKETE